MALIVETGQLIEGADSYVSLAAARELAAKFGMTFPLDDDEAEAALRNGALYVDLQEPMMCGRRVSASQSLAFPRSGIKLFGFDVARGIIPSQVIRAQVIAAAEYATGAAVRGSSDGRAVASERVEGAVAVSYFNNGSNGSTVTITASIDALRPLLCGLNNGSSFNVYRG